MKNDSKNEVTKRKYFSLWDLTVLMVVLVASACCLLPVLGAASGDEPEGLQAVITVDGVEQDTINLSAVSEPFEYTIQGDVRVTLSISSEGVCFLDSACPDKLCVNTGMLTSSGQSAVCLPARVSVKLVSASLEDKDVPDVVVG